MTLKPLIDPSPAYDFLPQQPLVVGFNRVYTGADLTLSGNEITDTLRALGAQGDGLSNDSSVGVYESATNKCLNGGLETNSTNWQGNAGGAVARSLAYSKFGVASLQCSVTAAINDGLIYVHPTAGQFASGNVVTQSIWIYNADEQSNDYTLVHSWRNSVSGMISESSSTFSVAPGTWTKIERSAVAPGLTSKLYLKVTSAAARMHTFYVDGYQAELGYVSTPYIETDGAEATRAASAITAPSTMFSETQGWMAFRFRVNWAYNVTTRPGGAFPGLFKWDNGSTKYLMLYLSGGTVNFKTANGGGATTHTATGVNWAKGDILTIIVRWGSSKIGLSVNGAAFTETAASTITAGDLNSTFVIGKADSGNSLYGDIKWIAGGKGAPTDSDATNIHAKGSDDTPIWSFPQTPTFVWPASTPTSKYTRRI